MEDRIDRQSIRVLDSAGFIGMTLEGACDPIGGKSVGRIHRDSAAGGSRARGFPSDAGRYAPTEDFDEMASMWWGSLRSVCGGMNMPGRVAGR